MEVGRGRTARGRLLALDQYLVCCERELIARSGGEWIGAAFVDVGLGDHPWTTLESAERLHAVNPRLRVIGVDRDPARVASAAAFADAWTGFRLGGFALPLAPGESARLIRAMNVLRGYRAEEVADAHGQLAAALCPSGLLVEGSSDATGEVLVAHLIRRGKQGPMREALLFHTRFTRGFAPLLFRDWLPRDLRRRVRPGEAIHGFFAAWTAAWEEARGSGATAPGAAFRGSIERLASRLDGVALDAWLLENGYLLWRPPGGVPA